MKNACAVRFGDRAAVGDARADRDGETGQILSGERQRDRHAVGVGKLNVGEALRLAGALVEHELDVRHLAARAKVLKERHVVDLAAVCVCMQIHESKGNWEIGGKIRK